MLEKNNFETLITKLIFIYIVIMSEVTELQKIFGDLLVQFSILIEHKLFSSGMDEILFL